MSSASTKKIKVKVEDAAAAASSSASASSAAAAAAATPTPIRHTLGTKRQPPLNIDTLLAARVDASHNTVLENGHCPPQFRTQGYVFAIDNGQGRRKLVVMSLLTERRIEAVQALTEVNDMSILQHQHVEIIGFLKAPPEVVSAANFGADGSEDSMSDVPSHLAAVVKQEAGTVAAAAAIVRKPYVWIESIRRVTDPREGDLFLREAMLTARQMEMDGVGVARAQPPVSVRYHEQHHPLFIRFLARTVPLSTSRYTRMALPAIVGEENKTERMMSVSTPFGEPIPSGADSYPLTYVCLAEALKRRTPGTAYNAEHIVVVKNEWDPMPKPDELCVLVGGMENASTFSTDMLVRYPIPAAAGQARVILEKLLDARRNGPLADEKNLALLC